MKALDDTDMKNKRTVVTEQVCITKTRQHVVIFRDGEFPFGGLDLLLGKHSYTVCAL